MKYKGYRCASYEGKRGSGGIAPRIYSVSTRQKLVKSFTSGLLFPFQKKSSGATALEGLGRQSGRRRSAKLVPAFADRGVSRGQRNGSPRPLVSVYRTWIATYFIQVAPQLTSRGSRG